MPRMVTSPQAEARKWTIAVAAALAAITPYIISNFTSSSSTARGVQPTAPASPTPAPPPPAPTQRVEVTRVFIPSGWMGDGVDGRKHLDLYTQDSTNPHTGPHSIRIIYKFGPAGWAGLDWQNEPNNWGKNPGKDYSTKGFSRLSFWARGSQGGEAIKFKIGGTHGEKYRDSLDEELSVTLTKDWAPYTIDLSRADLSSVIAGFGVFMSASDNMHEKLVYYIDDVFLE